MRTVIVDSLLCIMRQGTVTREIVELLIAKGADVNVKIVSGPSIGNTPLDLAASKMDNFPPKDKAAKKETPTSSASTAARRVKN